MITKTALFDRTRRLLGDEDARTYSDYQLACGTDDALSYLSRQCALLSADLTKRTCDLKSGDPLPDDLISLITLTDTSTDAENAPCPPRPYRIEAGTLIAPAHARLTYHSTLAPLGESDTIDLPASLLDTIARLTALTIQGADDDTKDAAIKHDRTLIARRARTCRRLYQPWKV